MSLHADRERSPTPAVRLSVESSEASWRLRDSSTESVVDTCLWCRSRQQTVPLDVRQHLGRAGDFARARSDSRKTRPRNSRRTAALSNTRTSERPAGQYARVSTANHHVTVNTLVCRPPALKGSAFHVDFGPADTNCNRPAPRSLRDLLLGGTLLSTSSTPARSLPDSRAHWGFGGGRVGRGSGRGGVC